MAKRMFIICSLVLLLIAQVVPSFAGPESFPPQRPDPMPDFYVPAAGSALDEQWVFIDTLFDASVNRPDLFSAFPVEMVFTHYGRGYLSTLHTVFRSLNYGESWENLDNFPPPAINSNWSSVRSPAFIYGMGLRYTTGMSSESDSLYLAVANGDGEEGYVRLVRQSGEEMTLWPLSILTMDHWITEIASSEHNSIVAFAGLDGRFYRQDLLTSVWDTLDYNLLGTWINDVEVMDSRMFAGGSNHIISEDNGITWNLFPAADPDGVRDLSFAPDGLHGLACGETSAGGGWVRTTQDGGETWSERTLFTVDPLRAVCMVSSTIGYVGGGNVEIGNGRLYRTSDGGQTWELELLCGSDIRAINASRWSSSYVNVVAAGVFPDFSCGIWKSRIFAPAESGPVLAAFPDSLDFGLHAMNTTDTLSFTLRNVGDEAITALGVYEGTQVFDVLWGFQSIEFQPDDEQTFDIVFAPTSVGNFTAEIEILNAVSDRIRIYAFGQAGISAADPGRLLIPESPDVAVWPNPGNAEFTIRYELPNVQNISLVCL